jgi:hypothetical protein
MSGSCHRGGIQFEQPGTYTIVVQGLVGAHWSERLAGMRITTTLDKGAPTTTLRGRLRDQTQLHGVLHSLYELHLSLLFVELVRGCPRSKIQ